MAERKAKASDFAGTSKAAESGLTGSTRRPRNARPRLSTLRDHARQRQTSDDPVLSVFCGHPGSTRRATVCNSRSAFRCAFAQFCQICQSAIIPFIHAGFVRVNAVVAQGCNGFVNRRSSVRFRQLAPSSTACAATTWACRKGHCQ